jgi:hypothetical protein
VKESRRLAVEGYTLTLASGRKFQAGARSSSVLSDSGHPRGSATPQLRASRGESAEADTVMILVSAAPDVFSISTAPTRFRRLIQRHTLNPPAPAHRTRQRPLLRMVGPDVSLYFSGECSPPGGNPHQPGSPRGCHEPAAGNYAGWMLTLTGSRSLCGRDSYGVNPRRRQYGNRRLGLSLQPREPRLATPSTAL